MVTNIVAMLHSIQFSRHHSTMQQLSGADNPPGTLHAIVMAVTGGYKSSPRCNDSGRLSSQIPLLPPPVPVEVDTVLIQ